MARFGFVGPSYSSESLSADAQRLINMYVEQNETNAGVSPYNLYDREGLAVFVTLVGETSVLQIFSINGRAFAAGSNLWEIHAGGTATLIGKLSGQGTPVYIAANNGYQIAISSGGSLYVYNLQTGVFTVAATGLGPISRIGYSDGYGVSLIADSQKFQISALDDFTQWAGSDVAQISVFPENAVGMLIDHREIWIWGTTRSVVYYNSGSANFPFSPIPGGTIEQGLLAADSPVRLDNSVFFLGGDERGFGVAYRVNGYTPVRVSNHAVESEWQGYATCADAIGYSKQLNGHAMWVLWFPTANKTWVFDCATNMWHEESFFTKGQHAAHRARCHCVAFGKHLVGDRASGTIYWQSNKFSTDFGSPIVRVRRAPHITKELTYTEHKMLQIHAQVGLGPNNPLFGTPVGYPQLVVIDSLGNQWSLTVAPDGKINSNQTDGTLATQSIIFLDKNVPGAYYSLTVVGASLETVPLVNYSGGAYKNVKMIATNGFQAEIYVSNGQLMATVPYQATRGPQITLRWSDDGGETWGNDRNADLGKLAEFTKRAYWYRLGRSRDRIYEMTFSDPVPLRIVDAFLTADPDFAPVQRIAEMLRKGA